MKKITAFAVFSILAFTLTACGASAGASAGASQSNPSNGGFSGNGGPSGSSGFSGSGGQFSGPSGLQIAAGMIKLDGTQYAVTPQEAARLLPLWKTLQQTESSLPTPGAFATPNGTTTPSPRFNSATMQQLGSEVSAIEKAMDPAQLQAISTMNLNRQDIATDLQQAGIQMGSFGQDNGGTFTPPNGTPRAFGTPEANGTPGGFGRFGNGARGGFASYIPPSVVNGIVQWLQTKAGS